MNLRFGFQEQLYGNVFMTCSLHFKIFNHNVEISNVFHFLFFLSLKIFLDLY